MGVVQRVVAEEGELGTHPNATVDDQLILLEDAFRFVLVVNFAWWRRDDGTWGDLVGVDEICEELMVAARIEVRDG